MTALNLIVQRRARAAFLLTDTARYDRHGRVKGFGSKVLELRVAGRVSGAIATTGMTSQPFLERRLSELRAESVDALLPGIEKAFCETEADLIADGMPARCGMDWLAACVALFDQDAGRPWGYRIANNRLLFPLSEYPAPYKLRPCERSLTRCADDGPHGVDVRDPRQWNPERDGAALLEAQRADLFGIEPDTYHGVGGEGILTRVDVAGVTSKRLVAWPDRVGRRIEPDRPAGGFLARLARRLAG